jgi:hypothetical protein
MILGFTGSRNRPTPKQLAWLDLYFFDRDVDVLHHGACVGSDLAAHRMALDYAVPVVVHPPIKDGYLAEECLFVPPPPTKHQVTVLERKHYHARNRDIVHAADRLIALPDGPRRPHSGTWYTIDYAVGQHFRVQTCFPDGHVELL